MDRTPFAPIIRSQSDLEHAWRDLMEPLGFGGHSVWMLFIQDDRPMPQITQIEEADDPPDEDGQAAFADVLRSLSDEFGAFRVAFLRSRPGRGGANPRDLAWAASLYASARAAGVPCEVVHMASGDTLEPIPLDALSSRTA